MAFTQFYYDDVNTEVFRNTIYALDIALENHYSNLIFKDETDRIVFSSNDYAFRKRVGTQSTDYSKNNINLPFMNYWIDSTFSSNELRLWNNVANIRGLWCEELQRNFRVVPIKVSYEATLWFHHRFDLQYAKRKLYEDDSNRTIIYPSFNIDGVDVPIPAILSYDFRENQFKESDWLEQNNIYNVGINPTFQTLFIIDDVSNAHITDTVILEFLSSKNLDKADIKGSDPQQLLTEYFTELDFQ